MKTIKYIFAILAVVIIVATFSIAAPSRVLAAEQNTSQTASSGSVEFQSPIPWHTLPELIGHISDWLTGIVASFAVIMIMIGGLMYVINSGNTSEAQKAKNYIKNSLIGLILVLSVNMIISEINALLGIGDGTGSFFNFATNLINWLIVIIAGLSVLFLMYAGFTYMTAAGDSSKSKTARDIIKYTLMGLVVSLLSYAIVHYIVVWFGI